MTLLSVYHCESAGYILECGWLWDLGEVDLGLKWWQPYVQIWAYM